MTRRVIFFFIVLCLATVAPTWVFVISALVYALYFTAYELILLALCIDAYYGNFSITIVPYYVLITSASLIFIEWVKPHISVYNQ
jgi:hypothetical protein